MWYLKGAGLGNRKVSLESKAYFLGQFLPLKQDKIKRKKYHTKKSQNLESNRAEQKDNWN